MSCVFAWDYGTNTMPQGLQVYSATGKLINDTNDRFPRIVGQLNTTAGVDGQTAVSIPAGSQPIFFTVNLGSQWLASLPYVSMTATSLTWQYRRWEVAWGTVPYTAARIMWRYY